MTITFGGVTLENVEAGFNTAPKLTKNATLLASGKVAIQRSTEERFSREYHCHTDSYTAVSNLLAKDGGQYDLVEDGTTYTHCEIMEWLYIKRNPQGTRWDYAVRIERDTS